MQKNVLDLNSKEARKFFLQQESYSNIELPPYFSFKNLLSDLSKNFQYNQLSLGELNEAKKNQTVNHVLYGNKDGKYAWRKYEIINPLIYLSLVNILTEDANWLFLKKRFAEFQNNKKIECESIPVLSSGRHKQKASQITHWVENIEKKSLALSLEYNFLYQTDISDCYGSIYAHSLPWAIHSKIISKNKRGFNDLFGNKIDNHIQAMSFGQTNGVPQGSVLMDFVAEIVLGYADSLLSEKLNAENEDYHILRYRDDYRIFVNEAGQGDRILKSLSEILIELGFCLNVNKTCFNNVVSGAIKKDKLDSLSYESVPKKLSKEELLRQLLIVQQISCRFPNSGTLKSRLSKILDFVKPSHFSKQEIVITGLLIDIAYNNPRTFPFIAGLISNCIEKLSTRKQEEIVIMIQKKICTLANAGLLEIWIQRMSLKLKLELSLSEKLCQVVYGNKQNIFETNWISYPVIKTLIEANSFIDKNELIKRKNSAKIEKKEIQIFTPYF